MFSFMCEMYFCLSELPMLHFYEIADNDIIDCILEYTISPDLKCVFKIPILMMNFHFTYFRLFTTCNLQ